MTRGAIGAARAGGSLDLIILPRTSRPLIAKAANTANGSSIIHNGRRRRRSSRRKMAAPSAGVPASRAGVSAELLNVAVIVFSRDRRPEVLQDNQSQLTRDFVSGFALALPTLESAPWR
jgi:hypothetical protein